MIHVRPIAESDRVQWEDLWQGYNEFYGRAGEAALDPAVTDTTWRRFLDPDEPVHCLVAELDGQLVGLAHVVFRRSTSSIENACYLQDLFTAEDSRGLGAGRALILAAHALAIEHGAPGVYWQTRHDNDRARVLYDKVGSPSGFVVYEIAEPPDM